MGHQGTTAASESTTTCGSMASILRQPVNIKLDGALVIATLACIVVPSAGSIAGDPEPWSQARERKDKGKHPNSVLFKQLRQRTLCFFIKKHEAQPRLIHLTHQQYQEAMQ